LSIELANGQNSLDTFPRNFPVEVDVGNKSL